MLTARDEGAHRFRSDHAKTNNYFSHYFFLISSLPSTRCGLVVVEIRGVVAPPDVSEVLEKIWEEARGEIREEIVAEQPPPLTPSLSRPFQRPHTLRPPFATMSSIAAGRVDPTKAQPGTEGRAETESARGRKAHRNKRVSRKRESPAT